MNDKSGAVLVTNPILLRLWDAKLEQMHQQEQQEERDRSEPDPIYPIAKKMASRIIGLGEPELAVATLNIIGALRRRVPYGRLGECAKEILTHPQIQTLMNGGTENEQEKDEGQEAQDCQR